MAVTISRAKKNDADRILKLQKVAFLAEAKLNDDMFIAPMTETIDGLTKAISTHRLLIAKIDNQIVGSVRIRFDDRTAHIGRLFVDPDHQGRGIGRALMISAEAEHPECRNFKLITGKKSADNIRLYEKLGYVITGELMENDATVLVIMEKSTT